MRLTRYGCENYKAFRDPATVELRPLTIFLGRNNSGKSALLRLPLLLLRALSRDAPRDGFPLEARGLSFGRVFRDLIHGGLAHGHAKFGLEATSDGERLDFEASVQNVVEAPGRGATTSDLSVVSRLDVRSPVPRALQWDPSPGELRSYEGIGRVRFRGLLPEGLEDWLFLDSWRDSVQEFDAQVSHLGPLRAPSLPTYEVGPRRPMGSTGAEAVGWLAADDELRRAVSEWLEENLEGWRLELDFAGGAFRCLLVRGGVSVNLCDAGQGVQQVLPVVVQQLARQREGHTTQFLDLLEQPELHLHAAGEAPLGDLLLQTARLRVGVVVVETHSENLLLRVRRRIAEGSDPELVALYWIDDRPEGHSTVRRIHIDERGEVDFWPAGLFSEAYEEVKALRRAARPAGSPA